MPTNRQILKEKVATYASVLLDGAYEAGGQDAVLEVRDQAERILRIARSNMDLSDAWRTAPIRPSRGVSWVRNLFASSNPVLVDVLAVMAEREDFALLSRVWASYGEQLERKLNVTVVDVTTVSNWTIICARSLRRKLRPTWERTSCCASISTSPCSAAY